MYLYSEWSFKRGEIDSYADAHVHMYIYMCVWLNHSLVFAKILKVPWNDLIHIWAPRLAKQRSLSRRYYGGYYYYIIMRKHTNVKSIKMKNSTTLLTFQFQLYGFFLLF